jgi:phospholipid/cholesterol/gamma-HCH transport system substrate-binding protein
VNDARSITAPLVKFLIFVVVTVLATGVLVFTIANNDLGSAPSYTARFTDVTALNVGDDVRIAGVKVGQVQDIRLVDRKLAEVRFTVSDRRLPQSVTATIKYRNLLNQRYIALDEGAGDPNRFLPAGGTIPLQQTKPALDLTVLLGGFKPLFQALSPDDVNKLSAEIIQVLQGEGGTMQTLLAHTASFTQTIAAKDQVIGQVINNLNGVLSTVSARDDQLSQLIVQLQQLVSGLAADRQPIGDAITGIGDLTNTTAGLLDQARPPLQQDIAGLRQVSQNLNNNQDITEQVLQNMPSKLNTITRTATYGSWFNFFLCKTTGTAGIGNVTVPLPLQPVTQQRCQR